MPAEITYWSSRGDGIASPAGIVASESRSTSGSSAQSGASPEGAGLVSIVCTTAAIRIAYGANPTADANSAYIGVGERVWMSSRPGSKLAAINA
jgi:hypothetical protein